MSALQIILVEDNDGDALIIDELLGSAHPPHGHIQLHRAASIAELGTLANDLQAACILLDLGLPDASGASAVELAAEAAPDVPIVVLTGSDDPDLADEALRAGAQDFLVKGAALTEDGARRAIRYAIERSAQTRELRASRTELREFAHRVAHDLKSPLAVLVGVIDIMRMNAPDAEVGDANVEMRDMAERSAKRLVDMVDRLLEYAESAGADHAMSDVPLAQVLDWVVNTLGPEVDGVDLHIDDALPTLHANETGLRHVFLNLVANAVKFADPDRAPRVLVTGTVRDGWATIEVCDNGRGIAPTDRDAVFDVGVRIHQDRPGSGLGLATARRTIELSGGHVEVDDGPGGVGTTIRLTLRSVD